MNYGLYLSAAGMLTNMHRQDVTANNLANVNTAGFKRDFVSFVERKPESVAAGRFDLSHQMMDRLGGATWVADSRADFSHGPLQETGGNFDLGIDGEGFFVVGEERDGQITERLTRDGRLRLDTDGRLVMSESGHPLLNIEGEPLVLDRTLGVQIDELGMVSQAGANVGQLRLVEVEDLASVRPQGGGLFAASAQEIANAPQAPGLVRQGFVEQSNVDPIREMLQMIEASRAIEQHGTMLRYHDQVMDRAVNVLGRVTA